jgi:Uma2 family endonuclease
MKHRSDLDMDDDKTMDSEVKEALVDYNKKYTYSDYITWDDDNRWELIDGVPYLMSAPNRIHQEYSRNLLVLLANYLKGKSCKVYHAPFDVRLNADTLDDTVVQPDILVICDHSKLDKAGAKGVPDLVVEILSPSTSRYDRTLKFDTYRKFGVKEFWIIDPESKTLAVNILKDGNYITYAYSDGDTVPVHVIEGLAISLAEVFEE